MASWPLINCLFLSKIVCSDHVMNLNANDEVLRGHGGDDEKLLFHFAWSYITCDAYNLN